MCHEHHSEGYESITEDVSIIKPDIDNSTKSENNAGSSSRGINLIHKKETKEVWCHLGLK